MKGKRKNEEPRKLNTHAVRLQGLNTEIHKRARKKGKTKKKTLTAQTEDRTSDASYKYMIDQKVVGSG